MQDVPPPQSSSQRPDARHIDRFVLMPHRSLGPRGFIILMALFGAICFLTGLAFLWVGAWPIMAFMGLDVLLLYVAFRVNYRAADLRETVEVTPDVLRLTRQYPSGRREAVDFNAHWAQVRLSTGVDGRTALDVGSHGTSVRIGSFLSDEERAALADALKDALKRHRGFAP